MCGETTKFMYHKSSSKIGDDIAVYLNFFFFSNCLNGVGRNMWVLKGTSLRR